MNRVSQITRMLVVTMLLAGCTSNYDPYAAYTPEEQAKLRADESGRLRQHLDTAKHQREKQLAMETLSNEFLGQRIRAGDTSPVLGIRARGADRFEGRLVFLRDPYSNRVRAVYNKGTYYSVPQQGMLLPSNGRYRGDIKYFAEPPEEGRFRTGTHVLIGEFTRHDGIRDVGIYVAERALPEQPLHFVKATPSYLDQLTSRYTSQIQAFRQQEQQRLQAERGGGDGLFGPLLALGLGGLILSSADIPGADVAQIGSALFQDVMSNGQTQALAKIARSGRGSYDVANPARIPTSSAAELTSQYSFNCPSGHSSVVPIHYKSASCLIAKQTMTRIYACNLVDQFSQVASTCTQGCGSPQCSE